MVNIFYILRAAPGSGKTTYVKNNFPNAIVCSADDYFINKNGVYKWFFEGAGKAHKACYEKFKSAVEAQKPLVVLDNTNTLLSDFRHYIKLAKEHKYKIKIIRLEKPIEQILGRNVHDVPNENVIKMYNRMQNIPKHWNITEEIIYKD